MVRHPFIHPMISTIQRLYRSIAIEGGLIESSRRIYIESQLDKEKTPHSSINRSTFEVKTIFYPVKIS
jgi:hypothetical protein